MGLECSHNAFKGAYSAFKEFRLAVASVIGVSYPPHTDEARKRYDAYLEPDRWYWDVDLNYSQETHPGLYVFFSINDSDDRIPPYICHLMAKELTPLLPKLQQLGLGDGHIARDGGYAAVCKRFIDGCSLAASKGECLIVN